MQVRLETATPAGNYTMDLGEHRKSPTEQERIRNLFELIPSHGDRALDVGTRDGFLAKLLAQRYHDVIALDLEEPEFHWPRVLPVMGNAADLKFPDRHFDLVLCTEVLEHVPAKTLPVVCREILRVCRGAIVIGVPYRQDLRCGRTTCAKCGGHNPPWGHVNNFDEPRLRSLFADAHLEQVCLVGTTCLETNWLSTALMDFAGNPYGTWDQEETCIRCGESIGAPRDRNLLQKVATRFAIRLNQLQSRFVKPRGNWIHALFRVT